MITLKSSKTEQAKRLYRPKASGTKFEYNANIIFIFKSGSNIKHDEKI